MKKSQKCMFVHCISLSTWDENLGVTNLTLCANFYLYNGMLLLHRWYWMPQSHTWQLLASTFRELWGLVVVLLWGKNRGKWKGWQLPEVESRTPQAWAASALPLSHSAHIKLAHDPDNDREQRWVQNTPPPLKWFLHAWFWILCLYLTGKAVTLVWPWNWIPVEVCKLQCV